MKKTSNLFQKALEYAVRGYSVMPLKKDKRPLLLSWKKYQTTHADEEQIESWWNNQYPDANIGIITGKISGIIVIDVDSYRGAKDVFPDTFTVQTGNGGTQKYYTYVEGFTISANGYAEYPNVDLRSDGGYVVAPPSVTDYNDKNTGKRVGGPYTVLNAMSLAPFPAHMFSSKKAKKSLTALMNAKPGERNDNITSLIGRLLASAKKEKEWETEVWPAIQRLNKGYTKPLPDDELRTTFESIVKKEKASRESRILSPIQLASGEEVNVAIRRNKSGTAYKDMANVLAVLREHPYYKGTIKYNEFRQEIEYNGRALEEGDLLKIQLFMQTEAELHGIPKEAVYGAVSHYSNENKYDEAKEWVQSLVWDKKERLKEWVYKATGVENDDYHAGIGSQWFMGMIRRIMHPGCIFDYVFVLVGKQGIGKTSLFRIIGGPWYKSYTGAIDNKDFYLALRGAIIIDLDEGAALYRSEAIKIKSIITETHDEYRAPYDRVMKKYPRRFVFSMSTNDTEPFRDVTGNRRYWTIDGANQIDFKWLEENRDQLFAEAYYCLVNKIKLPEVPIEKALESQEAHLPEDSWSDLVMAKLQQSDEYCRGDAEFSITIAEMYEMMFGEDMLHHLGKPQEQRIGIILRKKGGLESRQKMIKGERKKRWYISKERMKQLQENNAEKGIDPDQDFKDF